MFYNVFLIIYIALFLNLPDGGRLWPGEWDYRGHTFIVSMMMASMTADTRTR